MKLASYRPEIDGLRTIAVILVILHHLGWELLPGGYVGVDVFFVISGFLITSILYSDLKDGDFSIARFYKRRIIRLSPAYFLVLVVTSVAAFIFMLPAEILNYAQSVIYSTFFLANFFMWKEVGGYFATQSDFVPLLHLWSLAVEEQFYIFWPLTLYWVFRLLGQRFILSLVTIAILGGVVVSEWGVQSYPAAAYYLLPTRFFELMAGALLVFIPPIEKKWAVGRELLSLAGLFLIFYSATMYTTERFFPGFSAVVPCLGTALIIYFARSDFGFVGKALSLSPMVYIGKISYPAYLWHWPIIVFLNLSLIEIDLFVGFLTLAATLLLSSFTYHYIELPSRHFSQYRLPRVLSYGFVLPAIAAVCFSFFVTSFDGLPTRFSAELNLKSTALQSFSNKVRGRCNEGNVTNPLAEDKCILGVADRPVDFLLIGDSHANHFTGMFDSMADDAGVRGYDITQSNTIYLPGVKRYYIQNGINVEQQNFFQRNATLDKLMESQKYKAVVLAGSFAAHYNGDNLRREGDTKSQQAFEGGMRAAVRKIMESGALVFIVEGSPVLNGVSYDCTMINARFDRQEECGLDLNKHHATFANWETFLAQVKEEFPEIVVIEPDQVICDQDTCRTEIDGIPLYRDSEHLNQMGSELIGKQYVAKYGNPLSVLRTSQVAVNPRAL